MLKVMAATAAGAAVSGTGIESALATTTPSPNPGGLRSGDLAPKVRFTTSPGLTYKWVWGPSDFAATDSAQAWVNNFYSTQSAGTLWAAPHLPSGATLTEVWVSVIVNDTNHATVQLGQVFPWANTAPAPDAVLVSTMSPTVQNVQMPISAPILIDNSQFNFLIVYIPGTPNNATHQLLGARLGWINNPGLTLFPDPRRIVNGGIGATTMTSGITYGPIDATKEFDNVTATGIPVGATAAFCAVQSYTPGVLTLFPDGATDPLIANYSGTGTQGASLNMVYMMVPLSTAGKFKIHSYISGKVYVDAWGYVI
jgi:hypothetical protein